MRILFLLTLLATPTWAHNDADWIRLQGLRDRTDALCCGVEDCYAMDPADVKPTAKGYSVSHNGVTELIPYSEPAPLSPDGRLWICYFQRMGSPIFGQRRCVFDKPGTN